MKRLELMPNNGQKSFYGKAIVEIGDDGTETLYSYNTPIVKRLPNGDLTKLWGGWSATTGKHIKAFCGANKAEFAALPCINPPRVASDMTPAQSYAAMMARRNAR